MPVASLTSSITSVIGDHGLYAVFGLMLIGAVLPIGSELVMIYGGAIASGAFASQHVSLLGDRISTPAAAYAAIVVAGLAGNVAGALLGWTIGYAGGRPFVARFGRYIHVNDAKLDRAERWFDRFGKAAVPLGFALPLVRSFVAIPAGILRMPLGRFSVLAAIGSLVFCAGTAAGGWALGSSYQHFRHAFVYVDYAIVLAVLALAVYLIIRWRRGRSSNIDDSAADPAR